MDTKLQKDAQGSACSGATGRAQTSFCTKSTKSQAVDNPPNRFSGLQLSDRLLTYRPRVPSMTALRRFLLFCTGLIGVTLAVGIVGLLLNPSRAYLWTQSILWAFLGSLAVAPFLVFISSSSSPSRSPEASAPPFDPDAEEPEWPFEQDDEWPSYTGTPERSSTNWTD